MAPSNADAWPELPYAAWKDTCDTLHLWTQIVGKIRLAQTPWLNHSWHVTLYVTARGLTTSPIPYRERAVSDRFRLLSITCSGYERARGVSVDFRSRRCLSPNFMPTSLPRWPNSGSTFGSGRCPARSPIAFRSIRTSATSLTIAITLVASGACWSRRTTSSPHFRTGFLGKASPVHFFWGSFDLAVTRFSGRRAPLHPGGVPASAGRGRPRGLFARGVAAPASGRAAAGRSTTPPSIPTPIRPRRALRALQCARPSLLLPRTGRVHPALRCGARGARSRARADGLPAIDL